jgi:hypothetical protein
MVASKSNPLVEPVFKTTSGIQVYVLKDLTKISAFRGLAAEKAKRFVTLNITESELVKLLNIALSGINQSKPDIAQAISILHELKWRTEMICEEKSLLELAYIFLMLEGEDIEQPSEDWNNKKAALVYEHRSTRAFFLQWAIGAAGNFSAKRDADLLGYLEETKAMIERLNRHLVE